MKKEVFLLILWMMTLFIGSACKRQCVKNQTAACQEQVPNGTTCMAYWETWVYNPKTNNCEFKGYGGCSPVGFQTEAECENCECH